MERSKFGIVTFHSCQSADSHWRRIRQTGFLTSTWKCPGCFIENCAPEGYVLRAIPGVKQVHPPIFGLQLLDRRGTQTMLAAQLNRRQTRLLFLDHPDNLRLGETAFAHSSAPSQAGHSLHHNKGTSGGQVTGRTAGPAPGRQRLPGGLPASRRPRGRRREQSPRHSRLCTLSECACCTAQPDDKAGTRLLIENASLDLHRIGLLDGPSTRTKKVRNLAPQRSDKPSVKSKSRPDHDTGVFCRISNRIKRIAIERLARNRRE